MFGIGLLFRNGGLGLGAYVPKKKEYAWIPSAISGAISLGSTIFGASQSAKKSKEAKEKEEAAHNANMAYYKRKYNEAYADTAAGKNTIRLANNYADKNWKKAQGASAVGGGTDASTALAKQAGDQVVGNAVANIAANDTARKDAAGSAMANEVSKHAYNTAAQLRLEGSNIANAASSMGNAVGSAINSLGSSTDKTAQWNANNDHSNVSKIEKSALSKAYENNPDDWNQTKQAILGMRSMNG